MIVVWKAQDWTSEGLWSRPAHLLTQTLQSSSSHLDNYQISLEDFSIPDQL